MDHPHVIVIGAGSSGAAIAHDLALRGLRVTLLDRFGAAAGTTGHNQAQLHSGGRSASRMHRCYDHSQDGIPGFFSMIGGKTTTARHEEHMSDMVYTKLGITTPSRTRSEVCPANVQPASAIMNLRKSLLFSIFERKG